MEQHGNNNNTSTNKIDLTNLREVPVFNDDGTIKETFYFPITPPPPIVIEDSSDTETEEEAEEEQQNKKDEEKEEAEKEDKQEKEAEKAEAEKEDGEDEETEDKEEEEEVEEAEDDDDDEEEEEEEEDQSNKRRRIGGPAPQRADRSANNRSHDLTPLQPAPSMTANAQDEAQPSREVGPPLDLNTPPSPLPELDPSMDIVACMEEHGM